MSFLLVAIAVGVILGTIMLCFITADEERRQRDRRRDERDGWRQLDDRRDRNMRRPGNGY